MGYYEPTGFLEFEGTNSEKQMMIKLLQIMDVLDPDSEYELPADFDGTFGFPAALLGVMRNYNPEEGSFSPSLELELAPKLFAALFPNARFHYMFTPWYSVTMDDTETITAIYKDQKLMIRFSYYDNERAETLCRKLIDQDEDALKKYEEYLEDEDLVDDPDSVDWFELLGRLTESDGKEKVDSSYEFEETLPSRNLEYEKSFFEKEDLQVYLVGEQIKNKDISLTEYIKSFSFTEEQFQYFLKIAEECHFDEMSVFLLGEKHR